MLTLYSSWENCLFAFRAAILTGKFVFLDSEERIAARRAALNAVGALREHIEDLRRAAGNASQMARQVDFNIQIQRAQMELDALKTRVLNGS